MHLQISFIVFDSFWLGLGLFFFFMYVTEVKKDSHAGEKIMINSDSIDSLT